MSSGRDLTLPPEAALAPPVPAQLWLSLALSWKLPRLAILQPYQLACSSATVPSYSKSCYVQPGFICWLIMYIQYLGTISA